MTNTLPKSLYDYLERPKLCKPEDFWDQVRRTVDGKPIEQEQLDQMFSVIRKSLDLAPSDVLLDLACGNGRLGTEFFNEIKEYLGVDFSDYLIEIAKNNFERQPTHRFLTQSINDFCKYTNDTKRFTKILLYGSFAYLNTADASDALRFVRQRFSNIKIFFVGTIPDKQNAKIFFPDIENQNLEDHTTAIGRWYTKKEFAALAEAEGWKVAIVDFPPSFYQAHYRFNAILTPQA